MLATVAELLDDFRLAFISANAKPGVQLPEPLHIERPNAPKKTIGWRDLGRMLLGG